jgi:glycerophosphoryl diester phosphodiesterase
LTSDRVPVVLHDRDLKRTTNRTGPVDRLSLDELRTVDAGKGERIPTLVDILELVGDRAHFDIEIKQGGIEREVLDVLSEFPQSRWSISSFDWTSLERTRSLSTNVDLWPLAVVVSDALFNTAKRLNASAVSLYAAAYNSLTAPLLRDAGLDVVIWTVNDVQEAIRVHDLGAAGLCTDTPDTIISGLAEAEIASPVG